MQQITSRTKWRSSRNVLQAASNSFERTPQSAVRVLFSTSALALAKQNDEETSDGFDGQDASCPLSVDGEAVPGGEQAPTQGRPPRRSDPDLSAAREGDLSDRLHQQDARPGDWCALRARSTVSWGALVDRVDSCIYVYCGCM